MRLRTLPVHRTTHSPSGRSTLFIRRLTFHGERRVGPLETPVWLSLSEAVAHWATAVAIASGGMWAYYRFVLQRASQTALDIDLTSTSASYNADSLFVV